jgi:uncharacterized protein (DUF362 family)/Pyruvate/2-oxoacid:ferredoxin oxidoreductase delta subunit
MDNKVYIVRCPDYDQVEEKITELIGMMGGMSQFAAPGEKIVLKVNLLQPAQPEQAVSPHPAVVAAIARIAKQERAVPLIADSPGSGYKYNPKTLDKVYRMCGMYDAAKEAGIEVNLDPTYNAVSFPEGKLIKRFEVITPVLEADGVFNLCKLKTHGFMSMTGAVKNNFGVIPGRTKPGYHAKLNDTGRFATMLLDLDAYVSPRISVMDAVIGLEGEGPGAAGTPRYVGFLLAAKSSLALDVVASEIIGLRRENNPILLEAENRGLTPNRLEEVQVIGVDIGDLRIPDYKLPSTISGGTGFGMLAWWQKLLAPFFKHGMSVAPRIISGKCIACGVCRDACPVKAITIVKNARKHAHIDDKHCIRCYCCHEMCPEDAIELRQSFLYRMIM